MKILFLFSSEEIYQKYKDKVSSVKDYGYFVEVSCKPSDKINKNDFILIFSDDLDEDKIYDEKVRPIENLTPENIIEEIGLSGVVF